WYHGGATGVGKIAIEFGGDVDVDDVAGLDDARAGNAVRGFLIDADAGCTGKVIGHARSRAGAEAVEQSGAQPVQFRGGHAGFDGRQHGISHLGNNAPGVQDAIDVGLVLNRHDRAALLSAWPASSQPWPWERQPWLPWPAWQPSRLWQPWRLLPVWLPCLRRHGRCRGPV